MMRRRSRRSIGSTVTNWMAGPSSSMRPARAKSGAAVVTPPIAQGIAATSIAIRDANRAEGGASLLCPPLFFPAPRTGSRGWTVEPTSDPERGRDTARRREESIMQNDYRELRRRVQDAGLLAPQPGAFAGRL